MSKRSSKPNPPKTSIRTSQPQATLSAVEMGARQREISVSEFFTKNRHLLGFDNPRKALLTCVKEAVAGNGVTYEKVCQVKRLPRRPGSLQSLNGLLVSHLCVLVGTREDGTPAAQSSLRASLPVRQWP